MAEEPEEVLIENGYPPTGHGIDVGSEVPVGEEHHHGRRQDGECDEDQDGRDEHAPREQRQAEHRQPRCA